MNKIQTFHLKIDAIKYGDIIREYCKDNHDTFGTMRRIFERNESLSYWHSRENIVYTNYIGTQKTLFMFLIKYPDFQLAE